MRLGLFLASVLALVPMPASAALSERELSQAVATPPAGARLPALTFSDARGALRSWRHWQTGPRWR
ncbi:hypothetical protein [Novosphingobium panipatense]|uniref:hypothetical protein n=1 Tax=Novosphingobium panipatense TaxID=428991 RepID=UPI00361B5AA3